MELYGSNEAFGSERVDLSEKRWVLPPSGEGEAFPRGTADLLQIVTLRKDGSERVTYAFPLCEAMGETPETEGEDPSVEEAEGAAEVFDAAVEEGMPSEEPAGEDVASEEPPVADEVGEGQEQPKEEAAPSTYQALCRAVDEVNRLLQQAFDVSHRRFGQVMGVQVGIQAEGSGFTRVEMAPLDAHGQPSVSPLHLHIETGDDPGCPDSLSAMIEYNKAGYPVHVTMNEYGEDWYSCKVNVTINEKTGRLSVQKIEEYFGPERRPHLIYKRAWSPKEFKNGYMRDDRGGRGGREGRSDRFDRDSRGRDRDFRPRPMGDRNDRYDRAPRDRGGRYDDRRDDRRGSWDRDSRDRYDDRRSSWDRPSRFDDRGGSRERGPRYDDRRDDRGGSWNRDRGGSYDDRRSSGSSYNRGRDDRRDSGRDYRRDDRRY